MNGEGEQPMLPPEQMPANTPEGASVAGPPPPPGGGLPSQAKAQFQIQGGEATSRIIGEQTVQKGGG
jgi:hypothetical protein